MKQHIMTRCVELAEYLLATRATVREAAKEFKVSKSTVHKDVAERLKDIDQALYEACQEVLEYNLSERHIRGGSATKEKYLDKKIT